MKRLTSRLLRSRSGRKESRRRKHAALANVESLESRMMLAGDTSFAAFQNPVQPVDVNADGRWSRATRYLSSVRWPVAAHVFWRFSSLPRRPSRRAATAAAGSGEMAYVDVSGDNHLTSRDALMVFNALNGEGEPGDVAEFRLETTDLAGDVISEITVGQEFLLNVFVQDTRDTADVFGIGAAFLDVVYDSSLASVVGSLEFGAVYPNGRLGNTSTAGLIDEAGAFSGFDAPGAGEQLVFTARMRADAAGQLDITSNPADVLPAQEVLTFDPVATVASDDILYGTASINIVADQPQAPDLVAFAKALDAAGVEFWSTARCERCTTQREMFGDGAQFLPIREMLKQNGEITDEAMAAGVTTLNTWIFPDESSFVPSGSAATISLQDISDRSGVPIPMGFAPSVVTLDGDLGDVTVFEGSPLHIPLDGYDPNGGPLTYTVTSDNPGLVSTFDSGRKPQPTH